MRILNILGFFGKNLAKILIKESKNLQDFARSCQEIQEIPRFLSRVSKNKNEQENARGLNAELVIVDDFT